jgi:hypothetical protein
VKDFFNVPLGVMQKAMEYGLFDDISKKREDLE